MRWPTWSQSSEFTAARSAPPGATTTQWFRAREKPT